MIKVLAFSLSLKIGSIFKWLTKPGEVSQYRELHLKRYITSYLKSTYSTQISLTEQIFISNSPFMSLGNRKMELSFTLHLVTSVFQFSTPPSLYRDLFFKTVTCSLHNQNHNWTLDSLFQMMEKKQEFKSPIIVSP